MLEGPLSTRRGRHVSGRSDPQICLFRVDCATLPAPMGGKDPTLAAAKPPKRRRQVSLANNCVSVVAVKNASVAGVLVNKFPTRQRKRDKNHEGTYRYGFF
jgi:hypothetical protein